MFDEVTARWLAGQVASLPARMVAGPERELRALGALAGAARCRAYPCGPLGPRAIVAAGEAEMGARIHHAAALRPGRTRQLWLLCVVPVVRGACRLLDRNRH